MQPKLEKETKSDIHFLIEMVVATLMCILYILRKDDPNFESKDVIIGVGTLCLIDVGDFIIGKIKPNHEVYDAMIRFTYYMSIIVIYVDSIGFALRLFIYTKMILQGIVLIYAICYFGFKYEVVKTDIKTEL